MCSTAKQDDNMKILNLTITSTKVNVTYQLGKSGLKYTIVVPNVTCVYGTGTCIGFTELSWCAKCSHDQYTLSVVFTLPFLPPLILPLNSGGGY